MLYRRFLASCTPSVVTSSSALGAAAPAAATAVAPSAVSSRAFRPSAVRLHVTERKFTGPGQGGYLNSSGGLPFYGNIYSGRVNTEAYIPPPKIGSGLIGPKKFTHEDPAVRAQMDACPYFALCDMVVWHNMDPQFLDPGMLSREEHQLLLLYSRAYYEKWAALHSKADVCFPRVRTRLGHSDVLEQLFRMVGAQPDVVETAKSEFLMDDVSLIAMKPELWETAHMDEALRDHLSGRVLEFLGLSEVQQRNFFQILDQMRRVVVRRRDMVSELDNTPVPEEVVGEIVVPYAEAVTLHEFCTNMSVAPYNGQVKVYNMLDERGTRVCLTINNEDTFFDFLITNFYKANLSLATMGEIADANDSTSRYVLTIAAEGQQTQTMGRWF